MATSMGRRDNVVTISMVKSLKMLAHSVIWGTWIVFKKVAAMAIGPLWTSRYGCGGADATGRRDANAGKAVATAADGGVHPEERLRLIDADAAGRGQRDRPPPCLSSATYGVHSYVKVKGVKFHFVECGDPKGTTVLLLHGFPSCWITWHHQIPTLSKYFRVIAVDLKGFGDSDKPSARKNYRVESLINELVVFLSILGVDSRNKCHVIGHDLGALMGWYLVHLWPNFISKFVAISCPHPNVHWEYLPTSSFFNKNWICFSQLPYLPEMNALQSDLKIINQCYQHLSKTKQSDDLAYIEAYKYTFSRTEDWTGAINYFRNLPFYRIVPRDNVSSTTYKEEEMLQLPCLLITGSKDESVQMESFIKSTEFLKTSTLRVVDNASHFPHQEQPQVVNDLLISFLVRTKVVVQEEPQNPVGLVKRMRDMVSSTVQHYGITLKDSVQRKTISPMVTNASC